MKPVVTFETDEDNWLCCADQCSEHVAHTLVFVNDCWSGHASCENEAHLAEVIEDALAAHVLPDGAA